MRRLEVSVVAEGRPERIEEIGAGCGCYAVIQRFDSGRYVDKQVDERSDGSTRQSALLASDRS
jgi:hypothetical protein